MKTLKLIIALAFVSLYAFASDHPEANFGDYGIRHYPSILDYQTNYIGQVVKYLPSGKDGSGCYDDQRYFLKKAGGSYDAEYTISEITGDNERMTFVLTEVNGKKKVKMIINNQESDYSYGKKTYCITDYYTVPLFLVGKFNQDKEKLVGKTFGDDAKLEVTDALIQSGQSYKDYPNIVFEITDKSDGKKSFVGAEYVHDIDELGKVLTDSRFKCNYIVVGMSTETKKEFSFLKLKKENIKMYTVKKLYKW